MTRCLGIIRAGELTTIRGDAEEIRALADGAMGREIIRLRKRVAALETEVEIMKKRGEDYWRDLSRENHKAPQPMNRFVAWIVMRWAVLVLGREKVYGKEEGGEELCLDRSSCSMN